MSKKPAILIDCDGVLCHFVNAYLRILHEQTGRMHFEVDVTDFHFSKCVSTSEEDEAVRRHIDRTPGLVRNLEWHDGAKDALSELRRISRVVCVTSPHHGPTWMPERMAWLREVAGFDKRDIVFASNKDHVNGACLIEDKADAANSWHYQADGMRVGILVARPWNRKHHRTSGALVAHDWAEVVEFARQAVENA